MRDSIGTARRSPDGVVAVYRGPQQLRGNWGTSAEVDGYFDISDERVADWEVVYTPPPPPRPIGTVMRREADNGWWTVVVKTTSGWIWIDKMGMYTVSAPEPKGDWKVLNGPVVGARTS